MSRFLTDLAIKTVGEDDSEEKWVLSESLIYSSDSAGLITVPAGHPTDLASTPRLPLLYWLFGNVARKAAVLHDYLYSSAMFDRARCDAIMREAAEATNVSWFRRWAMWAGVRIGGSSHYKG